MTVLQLQNHSKAEAVRYCTSRTYTVSEYIQRSQSMSNLHDTLQTQPMIFDDSLCTTIITIHPGLGVLKLWRHWLSFNRSLQMPKLPFHIDGTSAAYWTSIRGLHMLSIASRMDAVTTSHEYDSLWRSEHVFAANWAIRVCRALYTAMKILERD